MNIEITHMGYTVALVKQYFASGLYNPQLEETLTVPEFLPAKGEKMNGFHEWFTYLANTSFCHIYLVAECADDDYRAVGCNNHGTKGIVVVCQKSISLWTPLWEVDEERNPVSVGYTECEYFKTESRPLEQILKDKPDFVFCEGTILSDNAVDNRKQLIASLENIAAFAREFTEGCVTAFAPCFEDAICYIQGKTDIEQKENDENDTAKEALSLTMFYHPDAERLLNGLLRAWVFGGVGSWNDTVKGIAEINGHGDRYHELTKDLSANIIAGFLFCINKMDLYTISDGFFPVVLPYSQNWLQQAIYAYQHLPFPHNMLAQKEVFHEVMRMDSMYLLLHRNKIDRSKKCGQPFVGNVNTKATLFICSDRKIAEKWEKDIPVDAKCFGVIDHSSLIALCMQSMYWGVEMVLFDGSELCITLPISEIIQHELQGKPMLVLNPPGTEKGDPDCPLGLYPLAEISL